MKIRIALVTAALAVMAVSALALSPENTEWGKGPAQFLMTKEEIAQWKAIKTDEEAARFVALFWARRDPTPQTPRNEFRDEFESRVRQADVNFKQEKQRGALTDRGKTYILYGLPTKLERTGNQRQAARPQGISTDPASAQQRDDFETLIWTYDGDAAKKYFNQPRAVIRFIDRFGNSDFRVERGGVDLTASQQRAITASITQPSLTVAPTFADPAAQQPAAPAAPAAPVIQTELTTDALKSAVAEFKSAKKSASPIYATTGEYVTANGVTYAPVLVYIPKASAPGADATFFGVVEDTSGKSVLAFEEPAALTASKDDFYVDKSLTLPAGKYRGYFGISGGGKTSVVAADMELTGALDKDATAASPLLLSNNVYALTVAQAPTDPFAFGGLKVVPKSDRTFRTTDELWYFVELRNPGIPEAPAATDTTVQIAPPAPKVQVKLDVEGTLPDGKKTKMGAPPMEVEAIPLKGVAGHYGIGSSIPLATFKPGDYTFTAKIIDTVKKSSYTFSEKFKVVQ